MFSIQQDVDVPEDWKIVIELPPEIPVGSKLRLTLISSPVSRKRPRTSLADWARENAEPLGDEIKSTDVEGFTGRRF